MDNSGLAQQLLQQLEENINEADQVRKVDDIDISTEKHPARLAIFIKKVFFKLLKWMIVPNQNRQTHFNGKVVNALNLQKTYLLECMQDQGEMESQRKRIILLENKVGILKKENDSFSESFEESYKEYYNKCYKENMEQWQEILNKTEENTNLRLKELDETIDRLESKIEILNRENSYLKSRFNVSCDLSLLENNPFDYFEFENKMRGARSTIKESQRPCIDYFKINGGGVILDLGCGRGEFLELMYDVGIYAKGTDVYEPFYKYCSERGFEVENLDALTYLSKYPDASVGGIFMGQVVEHVSSDYLIALIYMAYRKLKPGCYFILETPNPETLATYRNFYLDSGHSTPVHYLYLKEVFGQAGFESVERFDNPFADYPGKLEELTGEQIENLEEFNNGIRIANDLIFGCRDYTLIARK